MPLHEASAQSARSDAPPARSDAAADALLAQLNAFRTQPQACGAVRHPAAPALRLDAAVSAQASRVPTEGRAALQRAGYLAGRIEALSIGGVADAARVAAAAIREHCGTLMNAELRDLGVARSGARWTLVFVQPALDPSLGDWRTAGRQVLALVNEARRSARRCGDDLFPAAAPLTWSDTLAAAALAHSRDMAASGRFDHRGSDSSDVAQRVERQRYRWQTVGENIAVGPGSAQQVVAGWLRSPGHCANLMAAEFTQMGTAFVVADPAAAPAAPASAGIWWTQVFAAARR